MLKEFFIGIEKINFQRYFYDQRHFDSSHTFLDCALLNIFFENTKEITALEKICIIHSFSCYLTFFMFSIFIVFTYFHSPFQLNKTIWL